MRFPSLPEIAKVSLLFMFVPNVLFVEANHRSHTAPGADDPDFGRGLSKELFAESLPCFKGEDPILHAAAMEHDRLRNENTEYENAVTENGRRLRLRNG